MLKLPKPRVSKWDSIAKHKAWLDHICSKKLGIKTHEDWQKVTIEDIKNVGGATLIRKYRGSMSNMLSAVYPQYLLTTSSRKLVLFLIQNNVDQ